MIRFILLLFSPFRGFIERTGSDYNQFITILKLKLTKDDREARGITNKSGGKKLEKMLLKQSLTQIFLGTIFLSLLALIRDPFTYYYFAHLLIMVMMAMMIISEFTTLLFDTSENSILQPLPIKGNTLSLARNAHIFIYLSLMAFNLSVGAIIFAGIKFGVWGAALFLFTIPLNALFTLFFANFLYLGIVRIASGEQLKNVMMYFQIVLAIVFMAGYQIGLNMVDKSNIANMILPTEWFTFLIPPACFAGLIEMLSRGMFDLKHLLFSAEALLIPILAIFVTTRFLTPIFNKKLLELDQGDRTTKVKKEYRHESLWFRMMRRIFIHREEEKAAFKLIWKMSGRERQFKLSFYPSLGYLFFMILFPFFKKGFNLETLSQGDGFFMGLYSMLFISITLPGSLTVGNNMKESWIFKLLPLHSPAPFFKAAIKAAFSRFFIIIYVLATAVVLAIWGIRIIPEIIIAGMAIYFFTLWMYFLQAPNYPFSKEKAAAQQGKTLILVLVMFTVGPLIGVSHWLLYKYTFPYAQFLLIPVYFGLIWYISRRWVYKRINWNSVDQINGYAL